jgi:hypothetical protein
MERVGARRLVYVPACLPACLKVGALLKPTPVPALKAAKALALASYKVSLATSQGAAAALAPALLRTGKPSSAAEFAAAVEGLSGADVAAFASAGLKGGAKPAVVTYGSLSARLPAPEDIAAKILA